MAYNNGTPIGSDSAAPGTLADQNHPVNWVDWAGSEQLGVSPQAAMRGRPPALSWWMQRSTPRVPTPPQPFPVWLQSRPYDRGAGAYAPKFGTLPISPIGAGIYSPYKLPVIAGPGARYSFGAIWFDVQTIPTSLNFGATVPMESINALIATSHVGPSYRTTG
jgi:hypothetical protein